MRFADFLKAAWRRARDDSRAGKDRGDLEYFNKLCRGPYRVTSNHSALTPTSFLAAYHRCIASIGKRVSVLEDTYWDRQVVLFRDHDPLEIVAAKRQIRAEWRKDKCFLHPRALEAMISTAEFIKKMGWDNFKREYLRLPKNPNGDSFTDWQEAHQALDNLPLVGEATAWYLIRNLYGVSVFKPDVHIRAIAAHFFPKEASSLEAISAMAESVRKHWATACVDDGFKPVHLGEVDYVLWWYRSQTGLPKAPAGSTYC